MIHNNQRMELKVYTTGTWHKKMIAWFLLMVYMMQPMIASAEVIADPKAPGENRPLVQTTGNGLPIVQITTPSPAGVSRNVYQQFDVDSYGLILNNSGGFTRTQLAGVVAGNPYLGNGPAARIILNEVTGSNPSYLRGYTEVAGQKAQVIIANPNGIVGDGFGFINTSRLVLTTGTASFASNGSLNAFQVHDGQITIQGKGMNATNIDQVDLISRTVAVNADAWGKYLNVIAGTNTVDHNNLNTVHSAGESAKPEVAIDVGILGGMYAQQIYLAGTENGVGVNSKGVISASGGDITITNAGKIVLTGNATAAGNIKINGDEDVTNKNILYATGNIDVTSKGTLENLGTVASKVHTTLTAQNLTSTGTIGAGINNDGTLGTTGNLTITSDNGTVTASGKNIAAGTMKMKAETLTLAGSTNYAGGDVALTTTLGDINHSGATLETVGTLTADAKGTLHNDTGTMTAKQLIVTADTINNRSGKIIQLNQEATPSTTTNPLDNTGESLVTNGQLQLTAQTIDNTSGTITAEKQLNLKAKANIINQQGTIGGNGGVGINTKTLANQSGKIIAQGDLAITASNGIDSQLTDAEMKEDTIIASGGKLTVASDDKVVLSGKTTSEGNVEINVKSMNNHGMVYAKNAMDITTIGALENSGALIAKQNTIIKAQELTSSGTIGAGINNDSTLGKTGNLTITSDKGTVTTSGKNIAADTMTMTAETLTLAGSTNYAGGDVTLSATIGDINHNNATMETVKGLTFDAKGTLYNDNGKITADKLTATVSAISNRNGSLAQSGQGETIITLPGSIDNTGGKLIFNSQSLSLQSASLTNKQGEIQHHGKGDLSLKTTAGDIKNDNGVVSTEGNLTLNTTGDVINEAGSELKAKGEITIDSNTAVVTNLGTIAADKSITVSGSSVLNDSNAALNAGTTVKVTARDGDITNKGQIAGNTTIDLDAKQSFQNTGSVFTGELTVTADSIHNQGEKAIIGTTGNANLFAPTRVENKDGASIYSLGNIVIAGSDKTNSDKQYYDRTKTLLNQSATIEAEKNIDILANQITNQKREFVTEQQLVSTNTTHEITKIPDNPPYIKPVDFLPSSGGYYYTQVSTAAHDSYNYPYHEEDSLLPAYYTNYDHRARITYVSKNQTNTVTITQTAVSKDSPEGKILAGGNTTLQAGTVDNNLSWVLAKGILNTVANTVNNAGVGSARITTSDGQAVYRKHFYRPAGYSGGVQHDESWDTIDYYENQTIPNHSVVTEQLTGYASLYGGGKEVVIQAKEINNQTTNPSGAPVGERAVAVTPGQSTGIPVGDIVAPKVEVVGNPLGSNIALPTSGLYTIHTDPGNHYLVETNSKFTNNGKIVSSNYMLEKLFPDTSQYQKRLGDGFYEQKLIRDQIIELTGSQYLGSFTSSDAQYTALMDNGITYAKEFNLRNGIALKAEEMAVLTSDMVLMVEREVQGEMVLVPVVYLAQAKANDLKSSGALIKADNVTLTSSGNLANTGTISASHDVTLKGNSIKNYGGSVVSGNATSLTATTGDILNQSGTITGNTVSLTADKGNIINETIVSTLSRGNATMALVNQTGKIEAKDTLTVKATEGDIVIKGAQVSAGKDLTLTGGQNIILGGVQRQDSIKYNLEGAQVNHTTTSNIASSINAGGKITVEAKDITLQGTHVTAGGDLDVNATRNLQVTSLLNTEQINANSEWTSTSYTKETNLASDIKANGNIQLTTGNDMTLRGAKIEGKGNLGITTTGGNLIITAVQDETKIKKQDNNFDRGNANRALRVADLQNPELQKFDNTNSRITQQSVNYDAIQNKTSSLEADGKITMTIKGDATLTGAQVNAGNELSLTSTDGNILVTAVKDRVVNNQYREEYSDHYQNNRDDETVIASNLNGGSKVLPITPTGTTTSNNKAESKITEDVVKQSPMVEVNANKGNVTIEGSSIYSATGNIALTAAAGKDVTITSVSEHHESLDTSHTVRSGFFSTTVKDTSDHTVSNLVSGSTISGNKVTITSGNDLTVKASNVVGTEDVTLTASKNINITSAKETGKDEHYSYEKTSGIFSGGGLGFTIGSKSTKTTDNEQTIDQVGSTIGSLSGNVSITADDKVTSAGTTFIAGKDLNITGKDVAIDNTINTRDSQYKYEFKQSGLTVSLGGQIIDTATSLANKIERSGEVQDNRLKDLYVYGAYKDYQKLHKDFNNYELFKEKYDKALDKVNSVDPKKVDPNDAKAVQEAGNKIDQLLSINVSIGSNKTTYEQNMHVETVNSSNLNAGGNVNITATEGDINLKGTNITGKDITLDAKKDLNIESAQNKQKTDSKTDSSSWSIGGSFGLGTGSFLSVIGGVNASNGKENENSVSNMGSVINASDTLTIKSGNDTNINGSQVKGEKVEATIGGNLNIASLQDSNAYKANNTSIGFDFNNSTGSFNKDKTNSTYDSVINQAGISAGKDGFDIHVGKNTDLKGAVIASDATPDKNKLSTNTITYSDIQNNAKYDSNGSGFNISIKDGKIGMPTPILSIPVSGDADSTTKSAISPGTIEVRSNPNQDLSKLSRDPSDSLNALGKIFDKQTVQEKQELAQMFSQEASKLVGDIADREKDRIANLIVNAKSDEEREALKKEYALWVEGGTNKVLFHTLAGGLTAQLGGGDFFSGATGAGFNEILQKELKKIKDPALHQWASLLVGTVADKILNGDGTGTFTALNGTKYNFLSHWQTGQRDEAVANKDWEKVAYWNAVDKAQNKIINGMQLSPELDLNAPANHELLQNVSNLAQEALANPGLSVGDYDGFKISSTGAVLILAAGVYTALNVNWSTLTLGLPVLAKPINLPAWRDVAIDIEHIASGHMVGGSRVSAIKDLFPPYMNAQQVERAVRDAYRYGERVSTQGDRVIIRGTSNGMTIEMYVNTVTNIIETAYPKW